MDGNKEAAEAAVLEILLCTNNPNYPQTWPKDERDLYREVADDVGITEAIAAVLKLRAQNIVKIVEKVLAPQSEQAHKDPSVVFTLTLKDGNVVETWLRETISLPEFVLKLATIAVGFATGEAERL